MADYGSYCSEKNKMTMLRVCLLSSIVLPIMTISVFADESKDTYLGEFVGPSLPGYARILKSGIVMIESGSRLTETEGRASLRLSDALTKLCRQHGGIGIVNFRIDMELGHLSKQTDTTVEVTEHGVKYMMYGDCVLSAVPLESPTDKR